MMADEAKVDLLETEVSVQPENEGSHLPETDGSLVPETKGQSPQSEPVTQTENVNYIHLLLNLNLYTTAKILCICVSELSEGAPCQ